MSGSKLDARVQVSATSPFKRWAPPELVQLYTEEKQHPRKSNSSRIRLIEQLGSHSQMKEVWEELLCTHKRKFIRKLGKTTERGKASKGSVGLEAQVRALQVRGLIDACEKAEKISSVVDFVCSTEARKVYQKVAREADKLSNLLSETVKDITQKLEMGLASELSPVNSAATISKVITEILLWIDCPTERIATERDEYVNAMAQGGATLNLAVPVMRSTLANIEMQVRLRAVKAIAEYAQSPTGQAWTWRKKHEQRAASVQFQVELCRYFKDAYDTPLHDCIAPVTQAVFNIRHLTAKNVAKSIERYFETNSV